MTFRALALLLFAASAVLGQAPHSAPEPVALPAVLLPLPGAMNVVQRAIPGQGAAISYEVDIAFPAQALTEAIVARAKALGWHPRAESYFNPGIATSLVRGWTRYLDSSRAVPAGVHQWDSDWVDDSGALLSYQFVYRTEGVASNPPPPTPGNSVVRVFAQILSKERAERGKRELLELRDKMLKEYPRGGGT